jgi:hypothetical protein
LSKELFEMELVKESLEIDNMIHKLYGVGGNISEASLEEPLNEYDFDLEPEGSSLEDLKSIIITNSNNEEFKSGISSLLIDALSLDELELIKESISEYLE